MIYKFQMCFLLKINDLIMLTTLWSLIRHLLYALKYSNNIDLDLYMVNIFDLVEYQTIMMSLDMVM